MIERTAEGFEATCYMCEHALKGDTWQDVKDQMADYGWKQEYDTGLWITLCPDCWEL